MPLRVYNTLTRQKQDFQPVRPGHVGMYVCGPTVYKPSHVGHMVGPVIFDTVKRYLTYLGYKVTFVVNVTDIDDKIIAEANRTGENWKALAERITADYLENLKRLGVTGIDHFPRATEHIPDILSMIQGLIDRGFAYPAAGDVYFDVTKDADYGKLCNRDPKMMEAGARIEVSEKKRNPGDFALWKGAKPGEPSWESPWGPGRPGWHIECSAMSMRLLGETLDIHGGGLDLQFPHHENELAQSESYTGKTFAQAWMHNGLMRVGGAKISKTHEAEQRKQATLVVREVLQKHRPETLRFLLVSTHYRSPIEYTEARLEELAKNLDGFHRFFERFERITGQGFHALEAPQRQGPFDATGSEAQFLTEVGQLRQSFLDFMDDDFNTGGAVGVLNELLTALNRFADARKLEGGATNVEAVDAFRRGVVVLRELSQILGVFVTPPAKAAAGGDQLVAGLMQLIIEVRNDARKAKNFAVSDQIRDRLKALNITLEDRQGQTSWRLG